MSIARDYPESLVCLERDPAYLAHEAMSAGDHDGRMGVPFADGIARLGDVSADEYETYIHSYNVAAAKRMLGVRS